MVDPLSQAKMDIVRLETQFGHLNASVASMARQLEEVRVLLSEAKGGWRMLMLIGGAGAALGSTFSWLAQHITIR